MKVKIYSIYENRYGEEESNEREIKNVKRIVIKKGTIKINEESVLVLLNREIYIDE